MRKTVVIIKYLFILITLSLSYRATAQLDSCNVFLKGNYVEVGINVNGAYGSSVNAPSGYHPKGPATEFNTCDSTCTSGANLGFVADPDKDGWTTGTPAYFGDYFLPGYPQEGWSIMADGNQADAWNGGGECATRASTYPFSTYKLNGSNISYVSSGSKRQGIWQGSYDSLQITQITQLDTSKVFFTIYVSIVNTSTSTVNNVYYLRTVDPDNDEPEVGSTGFETKNNIDYQLPNSLGASLVSATSKAYSRCYLGLGTLDCRAKVFIKRSGLMPNVGTLDSLYGKYGGKGDTVNYKYNNFLTADVCINLVYQLGNISPHDSVTFAYTYILNKSDITDAFESITPQLEVDSVSHASGDTLTMCHNSTKDIKLINGQGYTWSWSSLTGDSLSTSSGTSVTVTTDTASISIIRAIGTSPCQNDTLLLYLAGPPHVRIDSVAPLCSGSSVKLIAHGASSYTWSPSTGLSCTSCDTSVATPTSTTTYKVVGTNSYGCTDSATATVSVHSLPTLNNTVSSSAICYGDSVLLTASGANTYSWSPSSGGIKCATCDTTYATPSSTTTFTVTGTDSNGCTDTDTVIITVHPLPSVNAGPDKAVCYGSTDTLSATGAFSYSWTPTSGLSCSSCSSPTASPSSTTTYIVTGTDSNSCSKTDTVVVTVNPLPSVNAGTDKIICYGSSDTLSASGASSYSWTPTSGLSCSSCSSPTASPTTTTTYIVTGTDANSCSKSDTVTVTVNPLPSVSAGNNIAVCYGSSDTLSATGASSYSWTPTSGLSCSNCSNPVTSSLTTTTYVVTGTDSNSCSKSDTVTVTVNPLPSVNAGPDKTYCYGNSDTLNASGASSYSWTPTSGLSCSSCANPVATSLTTTTYVVTGTDSNSCSKSDTVVVTVNPLPSVSAGADKAVCLGSSDTLSATGASSYSWTPTSTLSCSSCSAPTATPTSTTTYVVTGTDSNSCSKSDTVVVTVNPLPSVNAGADKAICYGSSDTLSATGASSYSWTPTSGLSCSSCSAPTASPTATTTYVVTGTDSNSCSKSDTVVITINPLPSVSAGPDKTFCYGKSDTLNASGASSYSWSPTSGLSCSNCANPVTSSLITTSYVVTGTDSNSCSKRDTVVVNVNALPSITASGGSVCSGGSVTLSVSGASSYVWTPSTGLSCSTCSAPVATPTATTTYHITATDTNGCTNDDSVMVLVNILHTISAGPDQTVCAGNGASLSATGATTFVWSPATGLSCDTCTSPTATPTATTTYVVSSTDTGGCLNTDTVTVHVNPLPAVNAGTNKSICKGSNINLNASGASSYSWTPATGLSCTNCANPTASPNSTTTYYVTGTDSNSCKNKDTITVTVNKVPILSVDTPKEICRGDSVLLFATGADSYNWAPSTSISCKSCDSLLAYPTKTTTYSVIGTDTGGCADTANISVTVNQLPDIGITHDTTICDGTGIQLYATGAKTYTWSPPTSLSCITCPNPMATPSGDITYTVEGVDIHGCKNGNKVTLSVITKRPVDIGNGDTICQGQTVQLHASGGTAYQWSPSNSLNDDTISDPSAKPDSSIQYSVIIKQGECFADTGHILVLVNPTPTLTVTGDTVIFEGETAHLHASGNNIASYEWTPDPTLSCLDCPDPLATPMTKTRYIVTAIANGGCTTSTDITVDVKCGKDHVFIPNTFTPNGDGLNDRFYPSGAGITNIIRFSIFDRWGEEIYTAHNMQLNDPTMGWDGTYKGKYLKPDVYVYYIVATCSTGERVEFKGDISLVR